MYYNDLVMLLYSRISGDVRHPSYYRTTGEVKHPLHLVVTGELINCCTPYFCSCDITARFLILAV